MRVVFVESNRSYFCQKNLSKGHLTCLAFAITYRFFHTRSNSSSSSSSSSRHRLRLRPFGGPGGFTKLVDNEEEQEEQIEEIEEEEEIEMGQIEKVYI